MTRLQAAQPGPRPTRTAKAPAHLKADGRAFWAAVLSDFELTDAHDLGRLAAACDALDRIAECRDAVAASSPFVDGRYGPKPHAALLMEDRQRGTFLKAVRELGLDLVEAHTPRQPSRWRDR